MPGFPEDEITVPRSLIDEIIDDYGWIERREGGLHLTAAGKRMLDQRWDETNRRA